MNKRYLFATIAVGIMFIGSALAAHSQELQRAAPATVQVQEKKDGAVKQARPKYDDIRCYQADSHDIADLCAQWRAAIAAENSAYYAKISNYVAFFGAILSFASVVMVLFALRYARAANLISQGIGNAQIRSYVRIGGMNAPAPDNLTRAAGCRIGTLNGGVIPAILDRIEAQGFVAEHPLAENHQLPNKWQTMGNNSVLYPGIPHDFTIQAANLTVDDSHAIVASDAKRLYYVARVTYRDAVGSGYVEQQCFSVNFREAHPRFEGANLHNSSS